MYLTNLLFGLQNIPLLIWVCIYVPKHFFNNKNTIIIAYMLLDMSSHEHSFTRMWQKDGAYVVPQTVLKISLTSYVVLDAQICRSFGSLIQWKGPRQKPSSKNVFLYHLLFFFCLSVFHLLFFSSLVHFFHFFTSSFIPSLFSLLALSFCCLFLSICDKEIEFMCLRHWRERV